VIREDPVVLWSDIRAEDRGWNLTMISTRKNLPNVVEEGANNSLGICSTTAGPGRSLERMLIHVYVGTYFTVLPFHVLDETEDVVNNGAGLSVGVESLPLNHEVLNGGVFKSPVGSMYFACFLRRINSRGAFVRSGTVAAGENLAGSCRRDGRDLTSYATGGCVEFPTRVEKERPRENVCSCTGRNLLNIWATYEFFIPEFKARLYIVS